MKKRILSLVLVALMLIFMIPTTVLAKDGETEYFFQDLKVGDRIPTENTCITNKSTSDVYYHLYKYKDDKESGVDTIATATASRYGDDTSSISLSSYMSARGLSEIIFAETGTGNDGRKMYVFYAIGENRPECAHSFSEAWTCNSSGHYHSCTQPDCDIPTSEIPNHTDDGFAYGKHDTKGPYGTCSVCGYLYSSKSVYNSNITVKTDGIYVNDVKTNLDSYGIYFEPASGSNAAKLILVNASINVNSGTDVTNPIIKSLIDLNIVTYGKSSTIRGSFKDTVRTGDGLDAAACIDASGHNLQISGIGNLTITASAGQTTYDRDGGVVGDAGDAIIADSIAISRGEFNGNVIVSPPKSSTTLTVTAGTSTDMLSREVVDYGFAFSCNPTITGDYTSITADKAKPEKGASLTGFTKVEIYNLIPKSHVHSYSELWTADGQNGHYHACTVDGCDVTDFSAHTDDGFAYAAHTYDSNDKCTVCDYEKEIIYVSSSGDDKYGDGSKANPYATMEKAREVAGTKSSTIRLLSDVATTGFAPSKGQDITLDLNGHTLTTSTKTNTLVEGASLTIDDSSSEKNGAFINTSGRAMENLGTLTLKAGTITGSTKGYKSTWTGAGVLNYAKGTFNMLGGSILDCSCAGAGAGVYNQGTFNMSGGTISGCSSPINGGGIYNAGTLKITGGTITGNTASEYGGGVYETKSFTMTGGTITDNTAGTNGGGVHIFSDADNPTVGGSAQITGNTKSDGSASNLNVNASKMVVISRDTTISNMSIGITQGGASDNRSGQFTTATATIDDCAYFSSDDPNFFVAYSSGKYLLMVPGHTVTFDTDGGSTVDPQSIFDGTLAMKPADPTKEGYTFEGWYYGDEEFDFDTPITDSITLTAKWTINTYTVTFDSDGGSEVAPQDVDYGETVTQPTAPTKEGYSFYKWLDKNGDPFDFSTPITEDITLKASWLITSYSVKYYKCAGDELPVQTQIIAYNYTPKKVANPTRKGYIFKGWYYNGEPFDFNTKVTCDMNVYAEWDLETHDYKITEGATQLVVPRYVKSALFKSNAEYTKFVNVEIDGKILDALNYTSKEGSTIIELKPEYLSTLSVGKHTIRIVSTDGYAETYFYIEDEAIAPTDGGLLSEATMSTAFVGFGIVGLSAVFYVGKKKKVR